ncbi:hypothetical protein [Paenibacillus hexagrammi]|uniref:Lipoprotein n=1 Tax=Paenibacillus hexagrammi TaxID=2908839 RepID=A0ABY3SFR7_9BACL|nr:hypothetical protein [Paenibacillus sp. YPD9-1]UJF32864.1 hypothetical protein L0M14_25345 [Paenibacillus sp. YPD9-1]
MKRLIVLVFIMCITGCSASYESDITANLQLAQDYLEDQSYQKALEQMKKVEDDFNLIRASYPKEQRDQFDKLIDDYEMSSAVLDQKQSAQHAQELQLLWEDLKKKKEGT